MRIEWGRGIHEGEGGDGEEVAKGVHRSSGEDTARSDIHVGHQNTEERRVGEHKDWG